MCKATIGAGLGNGSFLSATNRSDWARVSLRLAENRELTAMAQHRGQPNLLGLKMERPKPRDPLSTNKSTV
jgi:hypothetical protein